MVGGRLPSPDALVVDQCALHGQHHGDDTGFGTAQHLVTGGWGPRLLTTGADLLCARDRAVGDHSGLSPDYRPMGCTGNCKNRGFARLLCATHPVGPYIVRDLHDASLCRACRLWRGSTLYT